MGGSGHPPNPPRARHAPGHLGRSSITRSLHRGSGHPPNPPPPRPPQRHLGPSPIPPSFPRAAARAPPADPHWIGAPGASPEPPSRSLRPRTPGALFERPLIPSGLRAPPQNPIALVPQNTLGLLHYPFTSRGGCRGRRGPSLGGPRA